MPRKNPLTGKPLSGSAGRKIAASKKAKALQATRPPLPPGGGFSNIPPPPLEDTAQLITWGARVLAATMDKALRDPSAFDCERDQWRFITDSVAKLGMIRDKSIEQDRIKKLQEAVGGGSKGATSPTGKSLAQVPKPSTAR